LKPVAIFLTASFEKITLHFYAGRQKMIKNSDFSNSVRIEILSCGYKFDKRNLFFQLIYGGES